MHICTFTISCAAITALSSPCAAQKLTGLAAGATVRVIADRATNNGIRRLTTRGAVMGGDSTRLVLQSAGSPASDTIALVGVRRLERLEGLRSRSSMVKNGVLAGAGVGTALWFAVRQLAGSDRGDYDANGVYHKESMPRRITRYGLIGLPVTGLILGATIGREHWVRVPVPMSEFTTAR